jgi:hypothetical protein
VELGRVVVPARAAGAASIRAREQSGFTARVAVIVT